MLIADFMLVVIAIAAIVTAIWIAYSLGQANGAGVQVQQQRASSRETMFRESEYTEIVAENEHGYGLAVRDIDGGAEIVSFDGRDEIYQNVRINANELPAAADALSEHAVQKTELQA